MEHLFGQIIETKKSDAKNTMTEKELIECDDLICTSARFVGINGGRLVNDKNSDLLISMQVTMVISIGEIFDRILDRSEAESVINAITMHYWGDKLIDLATMHNNFLADSMLICMAEAIGWIFAADIAVKKTAEIRVEQR